MDNPFQSPAILSFCPGILGLERGIERAIGKLRVVAYVEIEAFIIANLVAGMEAGVLDTAPVWTDAKTFDAQPFRGKIHGIIGGYPCPGESLAGLREGHLYKGFLWPAIRKAIAAAQPVWCFFENVDDHLTGTYPIVQRSLRNMGYAVEAGIYSANEVGAPHERKRLFIMAIATSSGLWRKCKRKLQSEVIDESTRPGPKIFSDPVRNGKQKGRGEYQSRKFNEVGEEWDDQFENLAYSSKPGLSGRSVFQSEERTSTFGTFPSSPGSPQQQWEEPRTIKPGMGFNN